MSRNRSIKHQTTVRTLGCTSECCYCIDGRIDTGCWAARNQYTIHRDIIDSYDICTNGWTNGLLSLRLPKDGSFALKADPNWGPAGRRIWRVDSESSDASLSVSLGLLQMWAISNPEHLFFGISANYFRPSDHMLRWLSACTNAWMLHSVSPWFSEQELSSRFQAIQRFIDFGVPTAISIVTSPDWSGNEDVLERALSLVSREQIVQGPHQIGKQFKHLPLPGFNPNGACGDHRYDHEGHLVHGEYIASGEIRYTRHLPDGTTEKARGVGHPRCVGCRLLCGATGLGFCDAARLAPPPLVLDGAVGDAAPRRVRTRVTPSNDVEWVDTSAVTTDTPQTADAPLPIDPPSVAGSDASHAARPVIRPRVVTATERADEALVPVGTPYTVVDAFAGAGGLSLGFHLAGYRTLLAIEKDESAAATYQANFPDTRVLVGDIETMDDDAILAALGNTQVDVLSGGPPCQPFSTNGKRRPGDQRAPLLHQMVRLATLLRPHFVLFENVKGLLTMPGDPLGEVQDALAAAGYGCMAVETLLAAEYGVPQMRERIFLIATPHDFTIPYPRPLLKKADFITVDAAIGELRGLPRGAAPNHEWPEPGAEMQARISAVRHGGPLYDTFTGGCRRLWPGKPACTILANNGQPHLHPHEDRFLSVREMARVQGFPDSFLFSGSIAEQQRQVGNAVPPPLAQHVALALRPALDSLKRDDLVSESWGRDELAPTSLVLAADEESKVAQAA